ncbi:hypothetical protein Tco_1163947 [Tanacetum coccineum]
MCSNCRQPKLFFALLTLCSLVNNLERYTQSTHDLPCSYCLIVLEVHYEGYPFCALEDSSKDVLLPIQVYLLFSGCSRIKPYSRNWSIQQRNQVCLFEPNQQDLVTAELTVLGLFLMLAGSDPPAVMCSARYALSTRLEQMLL